MLIPMSDPIPLPTISINPYPDSRRAATANAVAGSVFWLLFLGIAFCAAAWAGMYAMAADGCPVNAPCAAADAAVRAMFLQCAGIATIVTAAAVGTAVQASRRQYWFHWPLAGMVLVLVCTAITSGMADAAMRL